MSDFWKLSSGQAPSGTEDAAHLSNFSVIPSGTTAIALLKAVKRDENDNDGVHYGLQWKLADGEFANRVIFQKIKCFSQKPETRDRALEMLMRLYKLCGYQPTHSNEPSEVDFQHLKGKMLGVKINQWAFNGKEGNNIAEIHAAEGFQSVTGDKPIVHSSVPEGLSMSSNSRNVSNDLLGDIAF